VVSIPDEVIGFFNCPNPMISSNYTRGLDNYNTIAISTLYSSLQLCSQSVTRRFMAKAPKTAIRLPLAQVCSSQTPVQTINSLPTSYLAYNISARTTQKTQLFYCTGVFTAPLPIKCHCLQSNRLKTSLYATILNIIEQAIITVIKLNPKESIM
jgi:hypothetical protein